MSPVREGTYTVCVYGSSSVRTPEAYKKVSRTLGNLLADKGHMTVNGAGRAGCMGALNDGVTERCGRVRGVIHEMWIVDKSEHPSITDLQVVGGNGLQERKRLLCESADCIITLPGGLGTWDELWEVVCLKGIGLSTTPICVIDVDDYYAGFKMQLERAHRDRLLYGEPDRLVHFETSPEAALEWCAEQLKDTERTRAAAPPPSRKHVSRISSGENGAPSSRGSGILGALGIFGERMTPHDVAGEGVSTGLNRAISVATVVVAYTAVVAAATMLVV